MTLRLVSPPAVLPLSLGEVRAQCRVDDSSEDALLMGYAHSAVSWIDGHEGWLGRALITQTYDLTLDQFPYGYHPIVRLPVPPVQAVTSITYVDGNGVQQTLAPSRYQISGQYVWPAYRQTWPATRCHPGAITVRFRTGYGDDWNAVPPAIRQALAMLVAYWFNQREAAAIGPDYGPVSDVPYGVKALLEPYRVWSV
jgi:uncharacterized phiE125 gp8 family phage protein